MVVAADRDCFIVDVGRESGVLLERAALDRAPRLGEKIKVVYTDGRGKVEARAKPHQMALGL